MKAYRDWIDRLEVVLENQAKLAGLLGHGTMIGDAREFLATRALRSVLPPSLHIGTGRVLRADGKQSKQIDIVVYDPDFPVLEVQPGVGIYLLEGVLATIEVKSRMNKKSLNEALSNCHSVTRLSTSHAEAGAARPMGQVSEFPVSYPCSYVFGYQSSWSRHETISEKIREWWDSRELTSHSSKLPEVIVAGKLLGLANRRPFAVGATGEIKEKIRESTGDDYKVLMGVWEVSNPFGWLLSHLLATAAARKSPAHKRIVDQYLPVLEYWEEIKDDPATLISETESD